MKFFFEGIFEQSINAGWVILMVLLLRALFKRAPKWSRELLWGLVAIRLVCPFSLESMFSLMPRSKTIDTPAVHQVMEYPLVTYQPDSFQITEVPTQTTGLSPASVTLTLENLFGWIWLAGILLILIFSTVRLWQLKKKLKEAVLLQENIYLCDHVDSPFILGLLRPRIYLPSALPAEDLDPILNHEKAHLRRKDHWIKPLAFLLAAIFWFHPLIWVAYFYFCRDLELACDERAIKAYNIEERRAYTETLLRFGAGRPRALYQPLAFGESNIKGRIKNIVSYKKPTLWIIIGALILCILAGVCLLTDPENNTEFDLEDIPTMNIGAEMPRFIYGDGERVILTGTFGILQYDVENQQILHRLPMEKLKKVEILHAYSNREGTTVYIADYVGEPVYQYDTQSYQLSRFKGTYEPPFEVQAVSDEFFYSASGLYSETYIEFGDFNYYLTADTDWRMPTLKLIKQAGDIASEMRIFPIETDLQEMAIHKSIMKHCSSLEADQRYCAEAHQIYAVMDAAATVDLNEMPPGYDIEKEIERLLPERHLTVYLLAYYSECAYEKGVLVDHWGSMVPTVIDLIVDENGEYRASGYWEPADGEYYEPTIRSKFPDHLEELALTLEGMESLQRICEHRIQEKIANKQLGIHS